MPCTLGGSERETEQRAVSLLQAVLVWGMTHSAFRLQALVTQRGIDSESNHVLEALTCLLSAGVYKLPFRLVCEHHTSVSEHQAWGSSILFLPHDSQPQPLPHDRKPYSSQASVSPFVGSPLHSCTNTNVMNLGEKAETVDSEEEWDVLKETWEMVHSCLPAGELQAWLCSSHSVIGPLTSRRHFKFPWC